MAHLQLILDRLIAENLHGPILTTSSSSMITYNQRILRRVSQPESPSTFQRDDQGLDSGDPRWPNLFVEFFLENSDAKNDDLLFFVRHTHSENESLDPVFVKRKTTPNIMPPLDDAVLWKETFFLNLIVQLPCKLTVAVCTRTPNDGPNQKTSMTCSKKHVSKRVYALPTKSRMDVKETSMECSYPLIYYVIDDYEDMFEHLIVADGEYLCVELAVTMPNKSDDDDDFSDRDNDSDEYYYDTSTNNSKKSSRHRRSMTNGPFPQPSNDSKITLFQGAASYSSLLGIYKQKAASKLNKRFKMGPVTPPTEYVMMRGPGGKGHAQVAITASSLDEADEDLLDLTPNESNLAPSYNATSLATGVDSNLSWNFNSGSNTTITNINNGKASIRQRPTSSSSFFQSLKRLSQSITDKSSSDPESLKCCMTFVNVPWTSIIT
ncbi:15894_t:CDS:2 [Funneliformis geosporum]|uniref:9946_t:CDS:1 n=1 Tax=Funneliformis geosporum TaxID=1117311 RepID=A0A9W4WKJ5_9GLOM|nr:9946_t:CDS:2 [Funneliformis geosporum]CAI2169550.1 15894_t:CDS:2 [Funneliformis geosporum]